MKKFFSLYQYIVPGLFFPLGYYFWLERYQGDHALVILTLSLPVVFAYVIPGIGTNFFYLWEFNTRLRVGKFRPHHGFVFGTATSLFALMCFQGFPTETNVMSLLRSGFIVGTILAFWNWIYDIYAVWHSQHMAHMAQFQASSGIFAGLLLPYLPKKIVLTHQPARETKHIRTAILGGGDIGFPMIFAGVVMKTAGVPSSLLIALGATVALFGLLWYGQKKRFYPAMPFLTVGCLAGYALSLLL